MVEDVQRFDSLVALLLVAKNKIDPFVKMGADVVRFERLTMHADEFVRVALGPWRQDHVV